LIYCHQVIWRTVKKEDRSCLELDQRRGKRKRLEDRKDTGPDEGGPEKKKRGKSRKKNDSEQEENLDYLGGLRLSKLLGEVEETL